MATRTGKVYKPRATSSSSSSSKANEVDSPSCSTENDEQTGREVNSSSTTISASSTTAAKQEGSKAVPKWKRKFTELARRKLRRPSFYRRYSGEEEPDPEGPEVELKREPEEPSTSARDLVSDSSKSSTKTPSQITTTQESGDVPTPSGVGEENSVSKSKRSKATIYYCRRSARFIKEANILPEEVPPEKKVKVEPSSENSASCGTSVGGSRISQDCNLKESLETNEHVNEEKTKGEKKLDETVEKTTKHDHVDSVEDVNEEDESNEDTKREDGHKDKKEVKGCSGEKEDDSDLNDDSSDSDTADNAEGVYVVEKIVEKDIINKKAFYFIKWKNWPDCTNTWEPLENLIGCSKLLKEFEEKYKETKDATLARPRKQGEGAGNMQVYYIHTEWPKDKDPISVEGVLTVDGVLTYVVKRKTRRDSSSGQRQLDRSNVILVEGNNFKQLYPQLVIGFYERKVVWSGENSGDRNQQANITSQIASLRVNNVNKGRTVANFVDELISEGRTEEEDIQVDSSEDDEDSGQEQNDGFDDNVDSDMEASESDSV